MFWVGEEYQFFNDELNFLGWESIGFELIHK